jgi:hypothetical protein
MAAQTHARRAVHRERIAADAGVFTRELLHLDERCSPAVACVWAGSREKSSVVERSRAKSREVESSREKSNRLRGLYKCAYRNPKHRTLVQTSCQDVPCPAPCPWNHASRNRYSNL